MSGFKNLTQEQPSYKGYAHITKYVRSAETLSMVNYLYKFCPRQSETADEKGYDMRMDSNARRGFYKREAEDMAPGKNLGPPV